jgi:preprotein translocase subunit YajC
VLTFFPVALAFAEDAPQSSPMSSLLSMAPLAVLFVVFYFLLIRPQQKKAKDHRQMLSQIEKGDAIITTGGIHGRIAAVSEDSLTVEIADNVRVKVSKDAVSVRKSKS